MLITIKGEPLFGVSEKVEKGLVGRRKEEEEEGGLHQGAVGICTPSSS